MSFYRMKSGITMGSLNGIQTECGLIEIKPAWRGTSNKPAQEWIEIGTSVVLESKIKSYNLDAWFNVFCCC